MEKIKVKLFSSDTNKIKYINKGEWIDIHTAQDVAFNPPFANRLRKNHTVRTVEFDTQLIPLDIAIQLPEGYEAIMLPRSSTFSKFGIMLANSAGVIDSSYCGDNDQWHFQGIYFGNESIVISAGTRICQFKIQLSQKATVWQKIKWLFSNRFEFEYVSEFGTADRGGFGTSGN